MNLQFTGLTLSNPTKIAGRTEDIQNLEEWNNSFSSDLSGMDNIALDNIRNILGQILFDINQCSDIIITADEEGINNPLVLKAREFRPIADNLPLLKNRLQTTSLILESFFSKGIEENSQYVSWKIPLFNLINTIASVNFEPHHINRFDQIAEVPIDESNRRRIRRRNPNKVREQLSRKVYRGAKDPSGLSILALREALQNAVDSIRKRIVAQPDYQGEIHVSYQVYNDSDLEERRMDLVIADNGMGMDLGDYSMLRKFYETGESGKEGEEGSTGGFGLAKELLFGAGQHGWAMDTNGQHVNDFHRNMTASFDQDLLPSASKVDYQKSGGQGATLSMFGIPFAYLSDLQGMCAKFADTKVKIYLNNHNVAPFFNVSELETLASGSAGAFAEQISNNNTEKEISESILEDFLGDRFGQGQYSVYHDYGGGKFVGINFAFKPASSGRVFYLLNGQYQFEEDRAVEKSHIIVLIDSNIRPYDEGYAYPINTGRDGLEEGLQNEINLMINEIADATKRIAESKIFKDGLDIRLFNSDMEALNPYKKSQPDFERDQLSRALSGGIYTKDARSKKEVKDANKEVADELSERFRSTASLDGDQKALAMAAIARIAESDDLVVDVETEVKKIMKDIFTPVAMTCESDFLSRKTVMDRPELTNALTIAWKDILELIIDECVRRGHRSYRMRDYIPGIIFSKEALGLFNPASDDVPYDTISINPMAIVPLIESKRFEEKLMPLMHGYDSIEDMPAEKRITVETGNNGETPITNVSNFLRHLAAHEATHYLFPDYYEHGEFHRHITTVELVTDAFADDIKKIVKTHMPEMRRTTRMLINAVAADYKNSKREASKGSWIKV